MDSRFDRFRALLRTAPFTVQSFLGLTDYLSRDHRKFFRWGFAMNGQTSRLEATRQIIHKLGIKRIVELGTFRGMTAEWFSQFGIPVETVEANERYFAFSKTRLSRFRNVTIFLGFSVPFLKERIAAQPELNQVRQLFYLDAHSPNQHLPLREELELIFDNYSQAIVLIDDFMVVDDLGYSYDSYGPDQTLNLEYLAKSRLPKLSFFYPSTPSDEETGARRGSVVLVSHPRLDEELGAICLFRKHNP